MLSRDDVKNIADELYDSDKTKIPIESITGRYPEINIEDAYKIQMKNVERRLKEGEKIIGKKIGLTSFAMQKFLGVYEPDYGHIFDRMVLTKNEIAMSELIQPKIEGEIAFIMKKSIIGPGVKPFDVIRSTEFILPSIEIIDSRVKDWKIKIQDTIADNASSAFIIAGDRNFSINEIDMFTLGMVIFKNGELINTGAAAAVLGNPINSVTWLINKLSEFGVGVKEGEIIMSGSFTAAVEVKKDDYLEIFFDKLGRVSLTIF